MIMLGYRLRERDNSDIREMVKEVVILSTYTPIVEQEKILWEYHNAVELFNTAKVEITPELNYILEIKQL